MMMMNILFIVVVVVVIIRAACGFIAFVISIYNVHDVLVLDSRGGESSSTPLPKLII